MSMHYRVRVLGVEGCRITGVEALSNAVAETLALLVAAGPDGVDRQRLAEQVWPSGLNEGWKKNLNRRISRVRRHGLEVKSDSGRYRLVLGADEVDSWHLEALVEQAAVNGLGSQSTSDQAALAELAAAGSALSGAGRAGDEAMIEAARSSLQALQEQARQLLSRYRDQAGWGDPSAPVEQVEPSVGRLERRRIASLVGRGAVLAEVDRALQAGESGAATPVIVLEASRGLGRTTVLAEVAHLAGDQAEVVELLGARSENLVVAPLTRLAPDLETVLRRPQPEVGDADWDTGAVARQVVDRLRSQAGDADLLVLIDDAHLFDGDAAAIVAASLVELAQPTRRFEPGRRGFRGVVLTTRSGPQPPWFGHLKSIWGPPPFAGYVTWIEVEPLGVDDLVIMVGQAFPGRAASTTADPASEGLQRADSARQGLVRWLLAASGGIPDVARHLLTGVAHQLQTGADQQRWTPSLERYDHALAMLTTPTRELAAHAAVLGRRFQLADLVALSGKSDRRVRPAVEELVDEGLVRVASSDAAQFADDLLTETFARSLNRGRRVRLHLRALDLLADRGPVDPSQRLNPAVAEARHRLAAVSRFHATETASALLRALHHLADEDRWWESWLLLGSAWVDTDLIERLRRDHGAEGSDLVLRLQAARAHAADRAGVAELL